MEFEIYVIYDSRSDRYSTPMFFDNDPVAIREIITEALKPYTNFNTHPQDFTLYKIGIYHSTDGTIQATQAPERVCCLKDYIVKEN